MEKLILSLVTAHMVGDYVFQNDFLANCKGKYKFILFVHSWLWSACVWIACSINNINISLYQFIFLVVVHMIIDKWKCNRVEHKLTYYLWVDQALHMLQIIALICFCN